MFIHQVNKSSLVRYNAFLNSFGKIAAKLKFMHTDTRNTFSILNLMMKAEDVLRESTEHTGKIRS